MDEYTLSSKLLHKRTREVRLATKAERWRLVNGLVKGGYSWEYIFQKVSERFPCWLKNKETLHTWYYKNRV